MLVGTISFAFVSNRQPTKEPSKVLQLPSFSCSVCTKSFHFFISLSYISKFTLVKTSIVFSASVALCGQNQHIFKNSHSFPAPAVQCAQSPFLFLLSLKHTSELTNTNFSSFKQFILYNNSLQLRNSLFFDFISYLNV